MSLASAKSNVRLVQNDEGKWCYPPTQRADGTWRKPIPVRGSYIPPDSQEKYVCRGRREAEAAAEAAAKLAVQPDQAIFEVEDTTDCRMEPGWKEPSPTVKKVGFSMPKMDSYWSHLVPPDPVQSAEPPQAPAATSNANLVDEFDGPYKMDQKSCDNSWNSASSQDVKSVPVIDFQEKFLSWKNEEDACDKLNSLNISEKKKKTEKEKEASTAGDLDEMSLAALLAQERKADMEDIQKLVAANSLSAPDYVNSWNYLVTKWIKIQQLKGDASNADIAKFSKSNKLMM